MARKNYPSVMTKDLNKANKSVAVIVAVFNKKDTIEKCINSILNAEWNNKTIIVIDNMSTDGSYEILKKFNDYIKLFRIKGGLSQVFNYGISKVDTDLIAFTDADCVVDKFWIKELVAAYDDFAIATAGYCGTPDDVSLLQKLIGIELENRFKKFPTNIRRAPTMNLSVKTRFAKKVMFDESFPYQAVETDFGYRLTELGKMKYTSKAIVWHYHRASLIGFYRQQRDQAKWGIKLMKKHGKNKITDPITTLFMTVQIPILLLSLFALILSIFFNFFNLISILLFLCILIIYIKDIIDIKPQIKYIPGLLGIFLYRNLAWIDGSVRGFLRFYLK